jgi:hypothetical protein
VRTLFTLCAFALFILAIVSFTIISTKNYTKSIPKLADGQNPVGAKHYRNNLEFFRSFNSVMLCPKPHNAGTIYL